MKTKSLVLNFNFFALLPILLVLAVPPGLKAQIIQNPGFETPIVGSVGYYSSIQYNPTGASWTFVGNAGIAANGSGFAYFNAGTPDGNQFAFLQGKAGVGGSMFQTISNCPAGTYGFTFIASQRDIVGRDNTQNQTVIALVDGLNVGSFTPADTNWYSFQTTPILLDAGNHVLTFTNIPAAGDATVRIDMINLTGFYSSPFSVNWFTVAGGGGTSTNAAYTVSGTFGQPAAGTVMGGGGYSVDGGFWSVLGAQALSPTGTPPSASSPPQSGFVTNGAPASFTVSVSGTGPLYYQWQLNGTNLVNGGNISGATTASLTLGATATNNAGNYSVIIESAYGSVTDSVAKLTVLLPYTYYSNYSINDLGTLRAGYGSIASGINDSGQVAGYSFYSAFDYAFLYSGGIMSDLGTLDGSQAYGINNNGQVVGYYEPADFFESVHAFLYQWRRCERPRHTRRQRQRSVWH